MVGISIFRITFELKLVLFLLVKVTLNFLTRDNMSVVLRMFTTSFCTRKKKEEKSSALSLEAPLIEETRFVFI